MVGDVSWSKRILEGWGGGKGVELNFPVGSAPGGVGQVILRTPQVFTTNCSSEDKGKM